MHNADEQNPFEVLSLDPGTPPEQIVIQAGRLRQRVTEELEWTAIRQAVQALTGPAEQRFVHEMMTYPAPCHHWPALEKLRAAFRRPPKLPPSVADSQAPAEAIDPPDREAFWQRLPEQFLA